MSSEKRQGVSMVVPPKSNLQNCSPGRTALDLQQPGVKGVASRDKPWRCEEEKGADGRSLLIELDDLSLR